ncbi:acyl-CoA thioester hydrolase [Mariprofundus ferrinatatus]|uniref:Acyl-CoA thioester hydrolase n=1 Tax=Mariprofundus ferrinatatus TaxID=1921087 RepID=A0A2K8L3N6_9PROT|nr:YbgC/FadM family acyl-CoA thioesterase [Mariprofundus ferrinatatus]ATX81940.1 acyl-CoA thioester hydrolase [Mariprofundus ferrinatatus]
MTSFTETLDIRVYYEDTDHGGVVYYANYLKFMERARSEFLRTAGLELDAIEADFGVMFAVTEAHLLYHAPALFNDILEVESSLTSMRGARIAFEQKIYRKSDRKLLTSGDIHLACLTREGRAGRIPSPVSDTLRNHLNPKENS